MINFDELRGKQTPILGAPASTTSIDFDALRKGTAKPIPKPIPKALPRYSKAGEETTLSYQPTAEDKTMGKILPRAVVAGLASGGLNVARAIPSTVAASLADGGTSKRYEEGNKYIPKAVDAKQMELANKIANIAKNISYPGTKLDTFISDTQKDVGELQGTGNKIFAQALMAGGQMAPAIATGLVAGPAIGMSAFGSQVYGGAFKEALDRGADTKTAGDYALGQTLLEVGTETLAGGIPGLGKGLISKLASSAGAKNLAAKAGIDATGKLLGRATNALFASRTGKVLFNALGEGGEEVIAEYLSPFIERATIDPNAPDATVNQIAEAFAIGGLMSFLLRGGGIRLSDGRTVQAEDVQTLNKSELNEVEDELYRLARESNIRKGKITPVGEPIQAESAEVMATQRGLPEPLTKTVVEVEKNGGFDIIANGEKIGSGIIMLPETDSDFAYIERIDVFDGNRRMGYGTKAIKALTEKYGDIYITPDNENAKKLYEKLGNEISNADYDKFGFSIDMGYGVYKINQSKADDTTIVKDVDKLAQNISQQTQENTTFGVARTIPTTNIPQRMVQAQQTLTPQPTLEPINRPVQARTAQSGTLPLVGVQTEKTRRFAETALGADIVGEELTNEIIGGIKGGMLSSIYKSNKSIVESADTALSQGINSAYGTFKTHFEDGNYTAEDIALGARLAQEYQRDGNIQSAYSVLSDLSIMLQAAGQTVQAAKIIKLLTPEGRLRTLAQIQNAIEKKTGVKISLNQSTLDRVSQAETENEIQSALNEARKEIWNKTPSTFADKFNTWRYTAMLGNPKTIMRNEIGNALFAPVRTIKNIVATGLEKTARLPEGKEAILKNAKEFAETGSVGTIRTKSILTPSDKPLIEFALKDVDNVMEVLKGTAKYGDMATATGRPIDSKVFGDSRIGKFIQGWSDLTTKALEEGLGKGFVIRGDAGWLKQIYSKSMAQFMKANELNPGDMTGELLNAARAYAIQEAQKGTYRDANIVSDWLTKQIKRGTTSKNPLARAAGYIAEGIVPFKRTPLNIARRAVEYSPVGLINGVSSTVQAIKSGENVQTAIDKLAAGLTGTGIVALGTFLASLGLLSGGKGDDKEERYKQTLGLQNYAINIDGKSYTLDWAAPISIPLFVGVELFEQMKDEFELSDILDAFSNVTDPLLEMSMLQGIANIFDTGYSQGGIDVLTTPIKSAAFSLAGQAVPTALGQIARTIDPITRRLNTATAESGSIRDIQYGISKNIISKLPVIQQTRQPYVDLWGRIGEKNETGDYVRSALENFLSVGYFAEEKITNVDKEIIKLFEETENPDFIPRKTTGYDVTAAGKEYRMTADEKTEFEKTRGSVSFDKLNSLFSTSDYKKMSTEEKNKAISKVYDEAYEEAKKKLALSRGVSSIDYNIKTLPSEKQLKIGAMTSAGIKKEMAYSLLTSVDKNQNGSVTQEELKNAIDQRNIPNLQKAKLWEILKTSTWKRANPYSN